MKRASLNPAIFAGFILLLTISCKPSTDMAGNQSSPLMKMMENNIQAPVVAKKPKELTVHGDTRIDPYYWLNDREDPEVIKYLTDENTYLDTMMSHTKAFREKLYNEMVGRIKQTDMSVPFKENGYYYLTRYEEGQEYPIHSRKKGSMDAAEEIMLNVNDLAKNYDYYAVAGRFPAHWDPKLRIPRGQVVAAASIVSPKY